MNKIGSWAQLFKTNQAVSYFKVIFKHFIRENFVQFFAKKCEKLLHCKSFSHFFAKKYYCDKYSEYCTT